MHYAINQKSWDGTQSTICENQNRDIAIQEAVQYFDRSKYEDGEYGLHEIDVIVETINDHGETVSEEETTLNVYVERGYDDFAEHNVWNFAQTGVKHTW